jgi:2-polyprenyl-3-methyl-5-hydroxy-6-metoxy-1,4-benzoquinol methylase
METDSRLNTFISQSHYTKPVGIKKLKFIFAAIERYTRKRKRTLEELQVLEIGHGKGGLTFPLVSLGCQVRALDINERAVEYMKSQIHQKGIDNLVVSKDDGCTFDGGMTYDVIIASEVFEHVPNPTDLAENIVGKMNERAYLIVTTPNGYGLRELSKRFNPVQVLRKINWLRHLLGKSPYAQFRSKRNAMEDGQVNEMFPWGHCQFYTKRRLLRLFSRFSLRLVGFGNSDSFLAAWGPTDGLVGMIDVKLADWLPHWLATGWYFVFEMVNGHHGNCSD